ncbi:hypothetical protein ACLB2K_042167 [Fragaria x ananassa]
MQMAEVSYVSHRNRQHAGEVVVVEVENTEISEVGELRRERAVEEVEEAESGDLQRDGTGEVVLGDGEIGEVDKEGDIGGEIQAGKVEGGHVVVGVALAVVGCPGREAGVGVVEGGLDREEGAVGGHWARGGGE